MAGSGESRYGTRVSMLGRRVIALAAAGVVFVVQGCSGGDSASSSATSEPETTTTSEPETTTTSEPETTTSEDPQAAAESEVLAAYEGMWEDYLRAGDPPTPDAPFLADHQDGNMLEGTRVNLVKMKAEGLAIRGTYETDAVVTQLGSDTAVVEDCGLDQTELYRRDTGTVINSSDADRDGRVAEVVLKDGSWKVSDLADDAGVCEP
ncbi:hypothetical protein BH20ACT2_BH20ACT2_03950 [soil metagenome]